MPIQGCVFHWTQTVFWRVQIAYNQKDSLFKFVGKLLALPFLPTEHIQETFQRLDEGAQEALAYWTWILSQVFKIHHWSDSHRNKNDM